MTPDVRLEIVALLPRLRRFARALCGAVDPADALVRQTCEHAVDEARRGPADRPLDSTMLRILCHLWLTELRPAAATPARFAATPRHGLIGALPEPERAVLALVCIEEMSYRETATILGLPLGTVLSRLSRARRILAAMDPAGPTSTGATTVSEDMLMAYADGVLEGDMADAVGRAVDADPDLVARFAALRRGRALVRAAFVDVLEEAVPPPLLVAAGMDPPARGMRRRHSWLPARWRR
jgi:RNA polymerase sigma-70 factor (ECF subfamily)